MKGRATWRQVKYLEERDVRLQGVGVVLHVSFQYVKPFNPLPAKVSYLKQLLRMTSIFVFYFVMK